MKRTEMIKHIVEAIRILDHAAAESFQAGNDCSTEAKSAAALQRVVDALLAEIEEASK